MDHKFKKNMEDLFDIEPVEVEASVVKEVDVPEDCDKDYEYSRATLYTLIEKGQEAVSGILELAQNSDHPRAYEVAATTIKNVAEVADKLVDLQKKMKELKQETKSSPSTVNNAYFVGSTAELSKMLKQASLEMNNK